LISKTVQVSEVNELTEIIKNNEPTEIIKTQRITRMRGSKYPKDVVEDRTGSFFLAACRLGEKRKYIDSEHIFVCK